ncbi:hypothetical protein EHO60_13220 [Leptospira fletcheri]|uniref:Uncharacterized protein n=1 Tax=Leptospira fletcheri TaxID=2484981 RepID=A0A4R9GB63_9LEPT|nr:hypothetical protein [Leptospira fletcheri]TGK08982.1 hypothetical protein EHO60_13220 [Leptospira fletcheri]
MTADRSFLYPLKFSFFYFLGIFTLGFLLGTVRTLVLAPKIGATIAVLIELPVILSMSWLFCGYLIRRFAIFRAWQVLLFSGAFSLVLLFITEFSLSVFAFGQTPESYFAGFRTVHGRIGLLGQITFALIPVAHMKFHTR